jgi:hypothetical protein
MSPDSIFCVAFSPVARSRSRKAIHSRATAACSVSSSSVCLRIPIESDHLFRSNPIADSGVSDHLAGVGVS